MRGRVPLSDTNPGQMIQVPNTLRLKVGSRLGGIDPAAIAKAEAALKSLSGNFAEWLQDEVTKLDAARQRIKTEGFTAETGENIYLRAHDLKGLGATYDYPIVTRIAGSLCKMIDDPDKRLEAPMFLIDAHIDAIKAAVKGGIQTDTHPVGRALVHELEQRARDFAAE
jgi:hypothetical protein